MCIRDSPHRAVEAHRPPPAPLATDGYSPTDTCARVGSEAAEEVVKYPLPALKKRLKASITPELFKFLGWLVNYADVLAPLLTSENAPPSHDLAGRDLLLDTTYSPQLLGLPAPHFPAALPAALDTTTATAAAPRGAALAPGSALPLRAM
eukprot:3966023-Prymnesium_polylepis.1